MMIVSLVTYSAQNWTVWFVYLVGSGLSFAMIYVFGVDTMRYLEPDREWDMYYLIPSLYIAIEEAIQASLQKRRQRL